MSNLEAAAPTVAAAPSADANDWDWTNVILPIGCLVMLWQQPQWGLTILPIAAVSIALERLRPYKAQRVRRAGWSTDLIHIMITWPIVIAGAAIAVAAIVAAADHLIPGPLQWARMLPLWLTIPMVIMISDLGAYFEHRACHRVEFLWRFHRVHHMGEDLDWLSRYRIHPLDALVLGVVELVPFYLFKMPGWVVAADAFFVYYQGTFAHSNIRVSFGRFWWVAKNPELHRWHHAKERRAANTNFCERFPIWDVIFKTAYMPRDRKPAAYGIPGHQPVAYVDHLLDPLTSSKPAA